MGLIKIQTKKAPKAIGPYSQAIYTQHPGAMLFVSGQLPIDITTGKLAEGDIGQLTNLVFDHIEAILEEADLTLENVVRVEVFLKEMKDFPKVNEEYSKRFAAKNAPSRQTIAVADLPLGSPIEISCIAVRSPNGTE